MAIDNQKRNRWIIGAFGVIGASVGLLADWGEAATRIESLWPAVHALLLGLPRFHGRLVFGVDGV